MEAISDICNSATNAAEMSAREFYRFSEFIYSQCGIKISGAKKIMLESRLRRRLRCLDMKSYAEYGNYLFSSKGMQDELVHMIDVVTTNKTDFYREPEHFDYLVRYAVPELAQSFGAGPGKPLMAWSAGCSTGEEPYTLAMVMNEFAERYTDMKFRYSILATDISTRALDKALFAIYDRDSAEPLPANLKDKYLMKSKDRSRGLVRIVPVLRQLVKFKRLNFMDADFGIREPMDIIFCRNVLIYFDRQTQEKLINKFSRYLVPNGYMFIGHSESMNGMNVPFVAVAPAIYRRISIENRQELERI
ncbi:MAG: chemotaxis protein CheR [Nitrospirae bacterium]|nr:chemotaxis protein CheR [Nitrospirota bacterium]